MGNVFSSNMKLKGVVRIYVEDPTTHKRTLWHEAHNTFVLSGMQWNKLIRRWSFSSI